MAREKSAILLLLWNCYSIRTCTEMVMVCSKGPCSMGLLGVRWVKPARVLSPWHLQVPIRAAELIELRHFQENIADQGHFRSVFVLVKSALV